MSAIQVSNFIQESPDRVFDVFADLRQAADRIEDITHLEVLDDKPIGVGTRWRETRRVFGKEHTEEMEITAFSRPHSYKVEAGGPSVHYLTQLQFEAEGDGTKVTMSFDATPKTFMTKIFNALTGPMMRKSMIKCLEKDMAGLKQFLESGDAGQSS